MVESTISGVVYLKRGDESFYSTKGTQDIFDGIFALSHDIPYYFLNVDNGEKLANPHEVCVINKSYTGVIHLLSSPGVSLASNRKMQFKFGPYHQFLRTSDLIIPVSNIGYIEYAASGVNYIAIPTQNVAAIQYRFVL
jgi:hypothetical protein